MSDLPDFDPQGTESVGSIPDRFLLGGLLALQADGTWTFRGEPITHQGVCSFLARQLRRTAEGQYWVVNGPQRVFVEVEQAPFFVTLLEVDEEQGRIGIRLNDKSEETLRLDTLFRDQNEVLFVRVKQGQAGASAEDSHVACLLRHVVISLESLLDVDEAGHVVVHWGGDAIIVPQHEVRWSSGQPEWEPS
jgi:hypothetical protein